MGATLHPPRGLRYTYRASVRGLNVSMQASLKAYIPLSGLVDFKLDSLMHMDL